MRKFLVFTLFLVPFAVFAQNFQWSMALENQEKGLDLSRAVELADGDLFSLKLSSAEPCHAYIVIEEASRAVTPLWTGTLKPGGTTIGPLRLTPPGGQERIYVVVSGAEQKKLKDAYDAALDASGSRAGRALVNEVMSLRRQASRLKENPEAPVAMGGAFRGQDDQGEKVQGKLYSGADLYVKTIIVKH